MQEQTTATFFIADKKINQLMKAFDLRLYHKVFISAKQTVSFKTTTLVDEKYILSIIEKSKEQKDYWVPVIEWDGNLYVSPEIVEISDGNKIAFVGKAENRN